MKHAAFPAIPSRRAGFTLPELLVTVAIVAIAISIGLPMLRDFIDNAAVTSAADRMLSSLNYARSEAVKRNARVTMCRSTDGAACATAAGTDTTGGDWGSGWIVFVDAGDAGALEQGDQLLRAQGAVSGGARLLGTGDVSDYVSYTSTGQARLAGGAAQQGVFSACASSPGAKRRKIALTAGTGWVGVAIVAGAASCSG